MVPAVSTPPNTRLQELDRYVQGVSGFNLINLPRRSWQSGDPNFPSVVFWMKSPMFLRLQPGERKPACPSHLHPWIAQAERKSRRYRANPIRPEVRGIEDGRLKNISQCTPPRLYDGDAVAMTFTVKYVEGENDFFPQYQLFDIVRLVSTPPPEIPALLWTRTALEDGEIVDGTCARCMGLPILTSVE